MSFLQRTNALGIADTMLEIVANIDVVRRLIL